MSALKTHGFFSMKNNPHESFMIHTQNHQSSNFHDIYAISEDQSRYVINFGQYNDIYTY